MGGGVILDPFIGSGTTAIACIKNNRHFIGFEIDDNYYKTACRRIETHKSQLTLFSESSVQLATLDSI